VEKATTTSLRNIRRITFEVVKSNEVQRSFVVALMPETYALDEPGRVNITQTRGGAFVDNFGLGIGTLSMSGTTGFTQRPNVNKAQRPDDVADGYERWVDFREFFRYFFKLQTDNPGESVVMNVLNWTQEDYLKCIPNGLPRLQRNVAQPLLYRYEVSFAVLQRHEKAGYEQTKDDILKKIAQQTTRAGVISDRIDEQIVAQWQQFLAARHAGNSSLPEVTEEQMDASLQSFVSGILEKNTPPEYALPLDNGAGLITRTRTLSEKIGSFAAGQTPFISTTLEEARTVVTEWRTVLDALDFVATSYVDYGREVRETLCACQAILTYPQLFRLTVQGRV
jgi:hypothetical protein